MKIFISIGDLSFFKITNLNKLTLFITTWFFLSVNAVSIKTVPNENRKKIAKHLITVIFNRDTGKKLAIC